MNTSLIILIVLVVVILVAILLTSPTCKNAVQSAVRGKQSIAPVVEQNNTKQAEALERLATEAAKKRNRQYTARNASRKPIQPTRKVNTPQKPTVEAPKNIPQRPPRNVSRRTAQSDQKVETPQKPTVEARKRTRQYTARNTIQPIQNNVIPTQSIQTPQNNVSAQVQASSFKTLSGHVENLFDPVENVAAEFGLTEAQLDAMARSYKKDFLEAPKVEAVRHKSYVRSEVEAAENKIRETFVHSVINSVRNPQEELVSEFYRDKAMGIVENQSAKKISFRSR